MEFQYHLSENSSIFTAELFAIEKAVEEIPKNSEKILICVDSLSTLIAIQNIYSNHPIIQRIRTKLTEKHRHKISFLWIPGHAGIEGNEIADKLAKEAIQKPVHPEFKLLTQDLFSHVKQSAWNKWESNWSRVSSSNKLKNVKNSTYPWKNINNIKRIESIKITRLRIGHTRLTQEYIFKKEPPPICNCGKTLSVKHIFDECNNYTLIKQKHQLNGMLCLTNEDTENITNIIKFLKESNLYQKI